MRKTIFFSTAILLAGSLFAQEAQPVVILQTTGKVSLVSKGKSKANPVSAGAVANPASTLKLAKGASALVYCGGQYKTIKDTDKAVLSSVCGNAPAARRLDIDHDLGEMILAAVDMVAVAHARGDGWVSNVTNPKKGGDGWGNNVTNPKKGGDGWGNNVTNPKKGGDGWGNNVTDPKKGGDGWGGKGSSIHLLMPFGNVQKGQVCFNWSKPGNKEPFKLEILDEKGGLVHTASTQDTFLYLDLAAFNLIAGQPYIWRVGADGVKKMVSNDLLFIIGIEKDRQEALAFASATSLSDNSELKALAEAVSLEKNEWFYDAHLIYQKLRSNNPSNLAKMMESAFWLRYGNAKLAEKALKK